MTLTMCIWQCVYFLTSQTFLRFKIMPLLRVKVRWFVCLTSQSTIFQSFMWRQIDVQADWSRTIFVWYIVQIRFLSVKNYDLRMSGAPLHSLSNIIWCSRWFCTPPPLFWGGVLLNLRSPRGGCCSISDDLSCFSYKGIWVICGLRPLPLKHGLGS